MEASSQQDLFRDLQVDNVGRIIKMVFIDLGVFGNCIDIFELGDRVRGVSLLECSNADVFYLDNL